MSDYIYYTADKNPAFLVRRYITESGKKLFAQFSVDEKSNTSAPKLPKEYTKNNSRPLYNLPEVMKCQNILLVEGEKTCDAALDLLSGKIDDFTVTTFSGGSSSHQKTDFSPLKGKRVVVWPDNDIPGQVCMSSICDYTLPLHDVNFSQVTQNYLERFPQKWDLADNLPEGIELENIIQKINSELEKAKPGLKFTPKAFDANKQVSSVSVENYDPFRSTLGKFRVLGYEDKRLVFIPAQTSVVTRITLEELANTKFIGLLRIYNDLSYWQNEVWPAICGDKDSNKADPVFIASVLAGKCYAAGYYSTSSREHRGIGCWVDQGRLVVHCGSHLLVNGNRVAISNFETECVYEVCANIGMIGGLKELDDDKSSLVYEAAKLVNWRNPLFSLLYSGWIVTSMISGLLEWRPHIWLIGNMGCGKSKLFERVTKPVLGPMAYSTVGGTSEAGIRQATQFDSRPVVFDEAESNNEQDMNRLAAIVKLIRDSSSNQNSMNTKGTPGGSAVGFCPRSSYCLSSVGTSGLLPQDKQRISILMIDDLQTIGSPSERVKQYEKFLHLSNHITSTPHFSQRLLLRIIENIDLVKANIQIATKYFTNTFGAQRMGEQYGTLIAGHWILKGTDVITENDLQDLSLQYDWSDLILASKENRADRAMLDALLMAPIRVSTRQKTQLDRPVSDLIGQVTAKTFNRHNDAVDVSKEDAAYALEMHGIKLDMEKNLVHLARSGNGILSVEGLLKRVNFCQYSQWDQILERSKNADAKRTNRQFFASTSRIAITIPLNMLLNYENSP